MPRPSQSKTVGDFEVTTVKLPTLLGSALRFKVNKLFSSLRSTSGELTPALITDVLSQLPRAEAETLIAESLICTTVVASGQRGDRTSYDLTNLKIIDTVFDGDVDALWESVAFAWEVNLSRPTSGAAVRPDPAP